MPARPSHRSRGLLLLACTLAATLAVLGFGTSMASAHDRLVATTPAQDAAMATPPAEVTLEFSRAVQELGAQVVVRGPMGGAVSEGAAEVRGATLAQPLATDVPAGPYQVVWRVSSSDGHSLSGEFSFTVSGGEIDPTPAAEQTAGSDEGQAAVRETAADQPVDSSPPYGVIALGSGLLLLAGGLVLLRRRT